MAHKTREELYSETLGLLETLSISDEERERIRKALAGMAGAKEPAGYDSNKPASVQGDDPAAAKLSDEGSENNSVSGTDSATNKPAGVTGDDPAASKLSGEEDLSHGDPLRKAASGLMEMAKEEEKERMSALMEFLANTFPFLAGKNNKKQATPKAGASDEKNSDAAPAAQSFSEAAPAAASAEGGASQMDEAKISALINQAVAQVEQKFSEKVTALEAENTSLKTELAETKSQTQQFSNSIVENAFQSRVNNLVEAGIPAVTVRAVAEIARNLRGTTQKLSDGVELDTAEALFKALETLPYSSRIDYGQVGQQFSEGDSSDLGSYDPYKDIVADLVGETSGK